MAQNSIDRIHEAEEQAARIRQEGAEKARTHLTEVQTRESRRLEEALKGARLKAQDLLREAQEASDAALARHAEERKAQLAAVSAEADTRLEDTARWIAERIVS